MKMQSNNGVAGAILIGLGVGLTAAGLVLVIPACMNWSAGLVEQALRKGREGVGSAAASLGDIAGHAQSRFGEAAKSAKATTSRAAGAVEAAARNIREYTS
ncbi:MAG: hypothetical protein M3Y72_15205 [Acidobacteriota bacterium]|nr:hypothetical protein [Acidobacteriota bacterium]